MIFLLYVFINIIVITSGYKGKKGDAKVASYIQNTKELAATNDCRSEGGARK